MGTSSHLRIYWLTIESKFSEIQVLGSVAIVNAMRVSVIRSECRLEFCF